MKNNFRVIAHRGASGLAKQENTIEAFDIAIRLGADMVEFDVRQTKDHKLVVFHNREIEEHPLNELTYEEINQITARKNYRVPLFKEVVERCAGNIYMDIELKESGFENKVVQIVKQYCSYEEYFIKSFKDEVVKTIKQIDSKITAGLLVGREHGVTLAVRKSEYFPEVRLKECEADFISPNYRFATKPFIRRMKQLSMPIYLWTINEEEKMRKYLNRGVDGIITDRPDILMQIVRDKNENLHFV